MSELWGQSNGDFPVGSDVRVARNIAARHSEAPWPHSLHLKEGEVVRVTGYPDRPDQPVEVEFKGRDELKRRTVYLPRNAVREDAK